MKVFRSTPILIKGILLAGILSACQNENDKAVTPQASASASDQNARTAVASGALLKDGNVELTYNSQGLLKKELYGSSYTEFTYTPQLITGAKFQNSSSLTACKYTLDASGRCVQTVTDKTFIYEYNMYGQLARCYNKDQPNERREFTYMTDADGWKKSLSKVTFYNGQGIKTNEFIFSYGGPMGVLDKHPLNPEVLPLGISKYLPVFGSFNTNLVQVLVENKYFSNGQIESNKYYYTYTLDYAGRAKNITVKKYNGPLISSTERTYFTPTYSF